MESREILRRAIEFEKPPRLPFFLGDVWEGKLPLDERGIRNDVCDCWEMDRQKAGWFFDRPEPDDWGCGWARSYVRNMGQVVSHPLEDWARLDAYKPPDPRDPFYFERLSGTLRQAGDRYVMVTSHFTLLERLHMLRGFPETLMDFVLEPEKIHRTLDMILDFKLAQLDELKRRFPGAVHGIFFTDDWGTQENTFVSEEVFRAFFLDRYKTLVDSVHGKGWHFMLHSCGKVNAFVPLFIEAGMDVLNLQQPRLLGIEEMGRDFAGRICFLTTVDIQSTLPGGDADAVRQEAEELVKKWSTPKGGFIVSNYGHAEGIGATEETTRVMFEAFFDLADCWSKEGNSLDSCG